MRKPKAAVSLLGLRRKFFAGLDGAGFFELLAIELSVGPVFVRTRARSGGGWASAWKETTAPVVDVMRAGEDGNRGNAETQRRRGKVF